MVYLEPKNQRPLIFQPLRKALLSSTPFNPAAPVNRFQLTIKEQRLPLMLNGQALDRRVTPSPSPSPSPAASPAPAAPKAIAQEAKQEPITRRVNPLTASRKSAKLNLVKRELIKARSKGRNSKGPKIIPAVGMVERECDRRFISDDGSYIDTSQKKIGGIDPRRMPAERRKNRQQPGAAPPIEEDEHIDHRGKEYKKGFTRVPMGSAVGAIFDLDVWAVDFSDAPRIPKHGACKNPEMVCNAPALESCSYCADCAAVFFMQEKPDSYAARLISQATRAKAKQEATDRRIQRLRAIHVRYETRAAEEMREAAE